MKQADIQFDADSEPISNEERGAGIAQPQETSTE